MSNLISLNGFVVPRIRFLLFWLGIYLSLRLLLKFLILFWIRFFRVINISISLFILLIVRFVVSLLLDRWKLLLGCLSRGFHGQIRCLNLHFRIRLILRWFLTLHNSIIGLWWLWQRRDFFECSFILDDSLLLLFYLGFNHNILLALHSWHIFSLNL